MGYGNIQAFSGNANNHALKSAISWLCGNDYNVKVVNFDIFRYFSEKNKVSPVYKKLLSSLSAKLASVLAKKQRNKGVKRPLDL